MVMKCRGKSPAISRGQLLRLRARTRTQYLDTDELLRDATIVMPMRLTEGAT